MSRWSALTTARGGLSLLCDVIRRMNGCWLPCACMQSWASRRSAFDSLPGGKHIISGREPDLLNFHQLAVIRIHPVVVGFPQPLPFFLSVSHRILFGGFAVFLFLTRRWQRNQGGKLLKNQTQSPFFGSRICCDWTWIRRNRRLHGWSRSGCWNRRRRPSRILKPFSRVPWKMGWFCADCWSVSARAPRRK